MGFSCFGKKKRDPLAHSTIPVPSFNTPQPPLSPTPSQPYTPSYAIPPNETEAQKRRRLAQEEIRKKERQREFAAQEKRRCEDVEAEKLLRSGRFKQEESERKILAAKEVEERKEAENRKTWMWGKEERISAADLLGLRGDGAEEVIEREKGKVREKRRRREGNEYQEDEEEQYYLPH